MSSGRSNTEEMSQEYVAAAGMSLRDFFAAAALAGGAESAKSAYKIADDMISYSTKDQ